MFSAESWVEAMLGRWTFSGLTCSVSCLSSVKCRSPHGLCSLKEGFRISAEGVPVLGVIKWGVTYDIARWSVNFFWKDTNNVLRDSCSHAWCVRLVREDSGKMTVQKLYMGKKCAWLGVLFTPPSPTSIARRLKFPASEMTSLGQLKKNSLFSPGWRFPRIPAPNWPQVATWLSSWFFHSFMLWWCQR